MRRSRLIVGAYCSADNWKSRAPIRLEPECSRYVSNPSSDAPWPARLFSITRCPHPFGAASRMQPATTPTSGV